MADSIYLDLETKNKINVIRQKNKEFKLSAFLRQKIDEEFYSSNELDQLRITLKDLLSQKEKLESEILSVNSKVKKILEEQEDKIKEIKQQELEAKEAQIRSNKRLIANLRKNNSYLTKLDEGILLEAVEAYWSINPIERRVLDMAEWILERVKPLNINMKGGQT